MEKEETKDCEPKEEGIDHYIPTQRIEDLEGSATWANGL